MHQYPTETHDEYLDRLSSSLQKLILVEGKNILCSLKTLDKVGDTDTPEKVTTEEEKFKAVLFVLRTDEFRSVQIFEDLRKANFLGRDE